MDETVQQIKERLSVVDVISQYVTLQRAGRNYRARCPFHKERTPSFMVSPERGTYVCFGCGEKGDIFSFVQKIEGVDFKTALRQLADKAGIKITSRSPRPQQEVDHDERLRHICEEAAVFFTTTLASHTEALRYLHERGVSDETRAVWDIGYAPARWDSLSAHLLAKGFSRDDIVAAGLAAVSQKRQGEIYDRFRGRIMFPIRDPSGRTIAFSGRFFEPVPGSHEEGEPAKYVNSPETTLFKKSRTLYGFNRARNAIRKADCILLVEGQFDLILAHQSGLPFTVALSGTALTPEHLSLLGRISKRLVLALDADAAGLRSGIKSAAMAYAAGFDVKVPSFSPGEDPADVARRDPEALRAAIRGSRTAIEFFLESLRRQTKDDRTFKKLVEQQLLPLIAAVVSKIDQEHFIGIVAARLRVSEDAVRTELARARISDHGVMLEDILAPQTVPTTLTSFDRTVGMLFAAMRIVDGLEGRIQDILGKERFATLLERLTPQSEQFLFLFEELGEDHRYSAEQLIQGFERMCIEERIAEIHTMLRSGAAADEAGLLAELSNLKRREQSLLR